MANDNGTSDGYYVHAYRYFCKKKKKKGHEIHITPHGTSNTIYGQRDI